MLVKIIRKEKVWPNKSQNPTKKSLFNQAFFMATVNINMTWQLLFQNRYRDATGLVPIIQPGQNPAADLAVIDYIGPGTEYWLTYPFEQYGTEYWQAFFATFEDTKYRFNLSTALQLTETLFGTEAYGMSIPDVWVLTVEVEPAQVRVRTF